MLNLENSKVPLTSTSKTNIRSFCIVIGDTRNKMTCRSSRDIKMRFLDFIFSSKAIVLNSDSSAQRHKYGEDQLGQLRYLRYFREYKSAW